VRRGRLIAAGLVIVLLAAPGAALAQGGPINPFAPGLPQSVPSIPTQPQTPNIVVPTSTSSSSGGSLSGGAAIAIAIGAVIVLGGISFFIWRDARKRAPVRQRLAAEGGVASGGSKPRPKPRKLSPAERRRRKRGRAR
jgi:hypothetical protein